MTAVLLATSFSGNEINEEVLAAFLLNPFAVASCAARTTTTLSNAALAASIHAMGNG